MLNIGQVVYDETNKRVVIFAGIKMLQNQKTGECHSESAFILKDGTFIHLKKDDEKPFDYMNFTKGGKAFIGLFVGLAQCYGCYFGIMDGNNAEVKDWAREAIEATEALIAKHGLNTEERESHNGPYTRYHIGPVMEYRMVFEVKS